MRVHDGGGKSRDGGAGHAGPARCGVITTRAARGGGAHVQPKNSPTGGGAARSDLVPRRLCVGGACALARHVQTHALRGKRCARAHSMPLGARVAWCHISCLFSFICLIISISIVITTIASHRTPLRERANHLGRIRRDHCICSSHRKGTVRRRQLLCLRPLPLPHRRHHHHGRHAANSGAEAGRDVIRPRRAAARAGLLRRQVAETAQALTWSCSSRTTTYSQNAQTPGTASQDERARSQGTSSLEHVHQPTPCAASKENGAHTASTVCALQSEYL